MQTKNKALYLEVKDHFVSGERFQLVLNKDLDMLETFPQPEPHKLGSYYQSEDYISHTDSKRNLMEWAYHLVRKITLNRKVRIINSHSKTGKSLLDVGCGTGDFLWAAKQSNWNITGIETNEKARQVANKKTKNAVLSANAIFELEPNQFDVITLWHVLEHLPHLEKHIQALKKLLKPDGTLIVAVPNFKSYDAQYYKSFWAAYDVPRHLWHFSRLAIKKLFANEGIHLFETKPMVFDAFYVSLLSEKYKTGSTNPLKAFWVGVQSNIKAKHSKEYSSIIYILKSEEQSK